MLFIDHQIGLMAGIRDFSSLAEYRSNIVGLARAAKTLKIPVLISSSNAQWQNGDTLPDIKNKKLFTDQPIYRRTGIINCYEDPTFRRAFEDLVASTGRRHVIISGVTIGTCCALPTMSMLQDGYKVFPVVHACGAWSRYEAEAAMSRMARAGAELVTTFALACELQADWKLPSAKRHAGAVYPEYAGLWIFPAELLEQSQPAYRPGSVRDGQIRKKET